MQYTNENAVHFWDNQNDTDANNIFTNAATILKPSMMAMRSYNVDYKADKSNFAYNLHMTYMKCGHGS